MKGRPPAPPEGQQTVPSRPKGFDDYDVRLGDIMRGERATMGKSLLDVQRDLKIKATYIAAIENSDPGAFETPGFIAGYVRSYARYLNLDPDWAYQTFCNEGNFTNTQGLGSAPKPSKPAVGETKGSGKVRDPFVDPNVSYIPSGPAAMSRIEPGAIGSVAVMIGLVAAIGYGGWSVLQEVQKVEFAPVEQAPGVLAELDPLAGARLPAADETETAGVTPPAPEAFDRLYRPQALDVPVLIARDGPIATLDPSTVGVLRPEPVAPLSERPIFEAPVADTNAPAPVQMVQVVEPEVPEVVLFAVRPSWVRLRAADGTVIFEKILDAGERYVLPKTEEPPTLRAGNAGSVYFAVNGDTYGPAGSGASVVRDVAMSADALREGFALADLDSDDDLKRFVAVAEASGSQPTE